MSRLGKNPSMEIKIIQTNNDKMIYLFSYFCSEAREIPESSWILFGRARKGWYFVIHLLSSSPIATRSLSHLLLSPSLPFLPSLWFMSPFRLRLTTVPIATSKHIKIVISVARFRILSRPVWSMRSHGNWRARHFASEKVEECSKDALKLPQILPSIAFSIRDPSPLSLIPSLPSLSLPSPRSLHSLPILTFIVASTVVLPSHLPFFFSAFA